MIYFLLLMTFVVAGTQVREIMKTSVVGCLPALKMHHIVIVEDRAAKRQKKNAYAIDFGHKSRHWTTKLKLLLGQTVPGEVRVRRLREEHEEDWMQLTQGQDADTSQQITMETMADIRDARLQRILKDAVTQNVGMNLYTNNCQHFSAKLAKDIQI
jgi:hypothetical protein